jgi:hypothetical protein
MMKRVFAIIAVAVLCSQFLGAQNFATRQLVYLAKLLKCPFPAQSSVFHCPAASVLPLKVEYDATGTVSHLGLSLFADSLKKHASTKPLYDFQERLFLEVFLQGNEDKARKLLREYKVQYTDDSQLLGTGNFFNALENSLRLASSDSIRYVLTKDSLTWTSAWHDSLRGFSIRFPANFDLITGMDKKESEIWLGKELQNFQCNRVYALPVNVNQGDLQPLNRSNYVLKGNSYFIQTMNSNLYFQNSQILYDRNYPEESIVNLFNSPDPQRSKGLDLQVRQTAYGGNSQTYSVKLSDFQCFMAGNYEVFTGIEKCNAATAEFSVIYKSRWYNYSHLLYIQTTPDKLFDKTEPLRAVFYTFIPNQNIQNLYREYVGK